jgi:sec-independent protein translocase protein TatA
MMGFGWQELLIVLVIVMIIFGAGKLTSVGNALGRGVKEFKLGSAPGDPPDTAPRLG